MRTGRLSAAILCVAGLLEAQVPGQTTTPDPAGVLNHFAVARFLGSGNQSIQAMTSDAAGSVYVAGTTSSPDFPVRNAWQAQIGEAVMMRSTDGGVTWGKLSFPIFSLVTITPHPSDPQTLFSGAADGIYKSKDGGVTWRKVYAWVNPANDDQIYIAADPANPQNAYFYAALDVHDEANSAAQLFGASGDGGESWKPLSAPSIGALNILGGAPPLWVDPNGSGTLALGPNLSRDHGNTWMAMGPLPMEATFGFVFTVAVPGHAGWIYAQGTGGGNLYLSRDWGSTWMKQPSPITPPGPIGPSGSYPAVLIDLRFDPDLPSTLWGDDGTGTLYSSKDAGATWNVVAAPYYVAPETPLALIGRNCNGGSVLAIDTGGAVVATHDSGANWLPEHLTRVVSLAAGPGCNVYAVKTRASNAFIAKLSPLGRLLWSTFLGGSDQDTPVGIALDPVGNVYVAGFTASPDFPITSPRGGREGTSNAFAAEFDINGNLLYSVVIGGESRDTVTGFAADSSGEAHLAGWTTSRSFPTTPGAYATGPSGNDGFALKLGHGGTVTYSSYLPGFTAPLTSLQAPIVAVAVEASGTALFGGPSGELARMSADGSAFAAVSMQPGPIYAMVSDDEGNIYVAGQRGGSPANAQLLCQSGASTNLAFLSKLQPDTLQESYQAWIGNCPTRPSALQVSRTGEATLGFWTFSSTLPLVNPLLLVSACPYCASVYGAPAIVRLSADGSTHLFSSYLDTFPQAPAIAVTPDGSTYASVTSSNWEPGGSGVAILRIPAFQPEAPVITGAFNAFSGALATAAPGMLLTITGARLSSQSIDLGLDDPNPLPTSLGTTEVLFDGIPVRILQATPDSIICIVPEIPSGKKFASMQLIALSPASPVRPRSYRSVPAESEISRPHDALPIALPVQENLGLLTIGFPAIPPAGVVQGNIRNADGTLNSAQNPAAAGSTVTLYATGVNQPDSIGLYWDPTEPSCFPFLMPDCLPIPGVAGNARLMPGFIDAIYAIDIPIPAQAVSGGHVISTQPWPVAHGIGIYVQ